MKLKRVTLVLTTLALSSEAHSAITQYECTLTVPPNAWQFITDYKIDVIPGFAPYDVLCVGDRFTLNFQFDGSAALAPDGSFPGAISGMTLTPWTSNTGSAYGVGPRPLGSTSFPRLWNFGMSWQSWAGVTLTPEFRTQWLDIAVLGVSAVPANYGHGLDEFYGPLTNGPVVASLGVTYLDSAYFFIPIDVMDFRVIPAPPAAGVFGVALMTAMRRTRRRCSEA